MVSLWRVGTIKIKSVEIFMNKDNRVHETLHLTSAQSELVLKEINRKLAGTKLPTETRYATGYKSRYSGEMQ